MKYAVFIRSSAKQALARIPPPFQSRIIEAIRALAHHARPPGVKKLSGRDAWRIRVSDYRVIYEIEDRNLTILIVVIGRRGSVYR